MKSSSLVKTSFSHFWSLFTGHWQLYGWYLLCRLLELTALALIGWLVVTNLADVIATIPVPLAIILGGAVLLGAFLLESWFVFSLYRSLDAAGKDHSLGGFLGQGSKNYWGTLGKYVLLGIMWLVLFYGGAGLASLAEGSGLETVLALVYFVLMLYLGLPFMLSMYEVVIRSSWPWSTFKAMRLKLKGLWWRMLGTLIVWSLLAIAVYLALGLVFGSLLFSNIVGVAQDFQTAASPVEAMEQFSQLFTGGVLFSLVTGLLVFVAASIVPVYGFFSVYKGVKKLSK